LRRPKNVTSHPKFLVQKMARRENDVESTFVLRGTKSANFLVPLNFCQSHL
jgi:hypothetical protein